MGVRCGSFRSCDLSSRRGVLRRRVDSLVVTRISFLFLVRFGFVESGDADEVLIAEALQHEGFHPAEKRNHRM